VENNNNVHANTDKVAIQHITNNIMVTKIITIFTITPTITMKSSTINNTQIKTTVTSNTPT
jgi:hypothetical protein